MKTFTLRLVCQTKRACRFKRPFADISQSFWLPKSEIRRVKRVEFLPGWHYWEISIPDWLADEKGLL